MWVQFDELYQERVTPRRWRKRYPGARARLRRSVAAEVIDRKMGHAIPAPTDIRSCYDGKIRRIT